MIIFQASNIGTPESCGWFSSDSAPRPMSIGPLRNDAYVIPSLVRFATAAARVRSRAGSTMATMGDELRIAVDERGATTRLGSRSAMFSTRITELFEMAYPIIQGGMRYVARAELAAAVAEGGGIGFISAHTQPTGEALLAEIQRGRSLTDKPFGVNLTILPHLSGAIEAIIASGVKFVETAGANPSRYFARLKDAGLRIMHKCTSVRFALKAQSHGADAISIASFEASGHTGEDQVPALILIPALARQLKIPFVSSGGASVGR